MDITKLKVSGYFRTEAMDKNSVTFSDLEVIIPHRNEEFFKRDAQRMLPVYLKKHKKLNEHRYEGFISVYVDDIEDFEGKPLCVGKDIKEMSWEELQSLSCYLNIREIKLYRNGELRDAREGAYMLYQQKILGKRVFKHEIEISRFEDEERQRGENLRLSPIEVKERVDKVIGNAFMMIDYPNDLKKSYNYAKLASLVIEDPEPEPKKRDEE